jgi:hypothetical protein
MLVAVMMMGLYVGTPLPLRIPAGEMRHRSQELLRVVVVGGAHRVRCRLDRAVIQYFDCESVDLHGITLSEAR